jgi:hypothetical protein
MAKRRLSGVLTGSVALGVVVAGASVSNCGGAPPATQPQTGSALLQASPAAQKELADFISRDCTGSAAAELPRASSSVHQGSSIALARGGETLYAYIADHDRDRLLLVNLKNQAIEASAPVFGSPEQVQVLPDGRVVVSIGDANHIEVFEPAGAVLGKQGESTLNRVCARKVPAGPFGLATNGDNSTLVVTSIWQPSLTEFDVATLSAGNITELPRAPRGVLVDSSNHAFVSHLVGGNLSVVDLGAKGATARSIPLGVRAGSASAEKADLDLVRLGSQAYTLASVVVDRPAHHTTGGQVTGQVPGGENPPPVAGKAPPQPAKRDPVAPPQPVADPPPSVRIVVPMVSVDPGAPERPTRYYYGPPPVAGVPKQAPVAVVVDPNQERLLTTRVVATTGNERSGECFIPRAVASAGNRMFVACLGLDEVLELDGRSADPMRTIRARYQVAKGPTGVAFDDKENAIVVYSQFDEELALVKLDNSPGVHMHLEGGTSHLDPVGMAGRETFYRSDDPRITAEGLACSSCHPDGTEDGITWSTPEGLRQTPMLAGRLKGTEPYGWTRQQQTLETYITDTCQRLGGSGLGTGELSELAAYIRELPSPPQSEFSPAEANHGREIFLAQKCDQCHMGATSTDRKGYTFDDDGQHYDTPSLKNIGITAPYFHDGRYKTLDDLLADPANRMGTVNLVAPGDRAALKAYLESL